MDKTTTFPKKNVIIFAATVVTCIVIVLLVMVFWKPASHDLSVSPQEENRLDRFFYEMGIQKIHGVYLPEDVVFNDMNGKRVKLSDFRGNIVFLNFWATWCPGCRIEMPSMEKLHKQFRDREFAIIAISLQEPAFRVKQFLIQNNLSFSTFLDVDGDMGSRFGAFSIPTTYIIDRDGSIIGKAVGSRDWYSKEALSLFEYLVEKGTQSFDEDTSFGKKNPG